MLFSTEKTTLLYAMEVTVKAISGRNNNPLLDCIIINVKDGEVTLKGSDVNTTIITKFSTMDYENGITAVNGRLILECIKKLKNDKVTIKVEESKLTIKNGKSTSDIVTQNADDYPKFKLNDKSDGISIVQSELRQGLKEVLYATAQEDTRPILTGVLFEVAEGKLSLVALDGYRLSVKTIPVDSDKNISVVIPAKALNDMLKMLENNEENISIKLYKNFVEFQIKETKIISRLLQGEFIKYNSLLPTEYKYKIKVNAADILDSISRVNLMSQKTNLIKLQAKENTLTITSNSQIGRSIDELDLIESNVDDFTIAFNSKYLMDIFDKLEGDIYMEFTSSVNPVIVKKAEDKNFTGLVLPVRLNAN